MTNAELTAQIRQMSERTQRYQEAYEARTALIERIRQDLRLSFSDRIELEVIVYSRYNEMLRGN